MCARNIPKELHVAANKEIFPVTCFLEGRLSVKITISAVDTFHTLTKKIIKRAQFHRTFYKPSHFQL